MLDLAFPMLAKMKALRGTALDPFGRTEERRQERALIAEYEAGLDRLLAGLSADRLALAVEIAQAPQGIRGFGHVKEASIGPTRARTEALWARWNEGTAAAS